MQQLELFPEFIKEQQKLANDDWEHRREQARLQTIKEAKANGVKIYNMIYDEDTPEGIVEVCYECTHHAISDAYNEMISEQAILCEFDDFKKDAIRHEYSHFDFRAYDVPYNFE